MPLQSLITNQPSTTKIAATPRRSTIGSVTSRARKPTSADNVSAGYATTQFQPLDYNRNRNRSSGHFIAANTLSHQSKDAYSSGDGAAAKQLSEEGKAHGRKMEEYNRQASEFIFRENNASGRVEADTIDLHGQFVEEAEEILEERIRYAKSHGQNHLHV